MSSCGFKEQTPFERTSGVTDWGIYVEIISNKCEGMIRLGDLDDDSYEYVEEEFAVVGRRTKNTYTLGDEVYVRVKNADLVKKLFYDPLDPACDQIL